VAIKSIQIRGVKGIREEVTLPLDGKSFVIQGENGTGKSSIVNALAWALRDELTPPEDAPYSSEESFRTHVLVQRDAPSVRIKMTDGGTIDCSKAGVVVTGSGEAYRAGALGANPILTRNKLLAVVTDKPADRFRYLESFLDLDQADEIREGLVAKSTEQAGRARQLREKVHQALAAVLAMLGASPESGSSEVQAALGQSAARLGLTQALPSWDQVVEAGRRARTLSPSGELDSQRAKLGGALTLIKSVEEQLPAGLPDLDALNRKKTELQAEATDAGLSELLSQASRHLAQHEVDRCPLCDQAVDHGALKAFVEARLRKLNELREVTEAIRAGAQAWQRWWGAFVGALPSTLGSLGATKASEVEGMPPAPAGAKLLHEKKNAPPDEFTLALLGSGARVSHEWVVAALGVLRRKCLAELERLPQPTASAQYKSLADAVDRFVEARTKVLEWEKGAELAERRASSFQRLGDAVRLARQDVAQRLLATISTTVADYYSRIHPRDSDGEVTDAPVIEIQRHRDGTAFVRGQFNGKRIQDPRWAYSDGHQDTIGLCIFLALRKYRSNGSDGCRLMVLDDVVLSIDLPHTMRVARLLREEFSEHQIIFLTHNSLVADMWKEPIPASQRIEITRWSLQDGPILTDHVTARDALSKALESGTATDIGQKVLGLMEEWVCQCRFEYQLSVPAKRGERYTLGDIWPKFVSTLTRIEKALKAPIGRLSVLLAELKDLHIQRNSLWGHYNEPAQQMPASVVKSIGRHTLELVDTLYCSKCESLAVPYPNADKPVVVACRCGGLKYGPPAGSAEKASADAVVG